jgi:hypothetical protein
MALKALICSGNGTLPQQWSVLRAIHTINTPKYYIHLLGGLSPIHSMRWRKAQDLMWGARGPFPPAAAMAGNSYVGRCWLLEANVRLTYCRNSKKMSTEVNFLFPRRTHTFLTSDPTAKKRDSGESKLVL